MENSYTIKKVLFTYPCMSKLSLRIFINTSLLVVSDPQILKLNPNEHLVWIQNWIIQSNPEWIN